MTRLRWRNVPVPEGHVAGIVLGAVLQHVLPSLIRLGRRTRRWIGWPFIVSGAGLALWAATEAGEIDVATPEKLLTGGPYAFSRHPMYVGWALIYLGISCVLNARWMVALFPAVVSYNHLVDVRREERMLERKFGDRYRAYRRRVRRYM